MENLLDLMDVLIKRDNIVEKLDTIGGNCPVLIYGNTYLTLKQTISIFKTDSRFSANVDISIDQDFVLDDDAAAAGYTLHIYVYNKETNRPVIRTDIRFHRITSYDSVTNIEMKVNYHSIDGYISGLSSEDISIHNIISLMFENAVDDIKSNEIDTYKYYLKNLKGALEFALIDFIKGE